MQTCQSITGNCQNPGSFKCSGCTGIELSNRICANYCGRECQVASFPTHKLFHSAFKRTAADGYNQTVSLALLEMKAINNLPVLRNNNTLSILFAGARNEIDMDFSALFSLLKNFIYPSLEKLEIRLVGPSLSRQGVLVNESSLIVNATINTIENIFNAASILVFDAIFIIAPGFTDFLDNWTPAINLFTESNISVIVTCYSNLENRDNDALFDEDCMSQYFRANIIVPYTINPRYAIKKGGLGYKNRYYFICKGKNENSVIIDRTEFKKQMSANYLLFQADFYGSVDRYFANGCRSLAHDLTTGRFEYRHQKNSELIEIGRHRGYSH